MKKRGRPSKILADGELSAKDKILETALNLFYQHGINSVGVDRIIAEADIAKMTFFKHFPTKRDLILEFLKIRDERYMNWVHDNLVSITTDEKKQLAASIEVMFRWFKLIDFRGCAFINTTAEVGPGISEEKILCVSHKKRLTKFLSDLAKKGDYKKPDVLADLLVTAIDGATIRAQMEGAEPAIKVLKLTSQILLEKYSQ